jgi:hypothetical protein
MPMGSVTCAVDQANKCVYSIGNKSLTTDEIFHSY